MLVLTRHLMEGVVITTPEGRRIRVSVGQAAFGHARLRFEADPDVGIWRDEIQAEIDARMAAEGDARDEPAEGGGGGA